MAKEAAEILFERLLKVLNYTIVEFDLSDWEVVGVLEYLKVNCLEGTEDEDSSESADEPPDEEQES